MSLPLSEIFIAFFLIIPRTRLIGLVFSVILLLFFTIYSVLILFNIFNKVPCSCGGIIKNLTWTQHTVMNLFLLSISTLGLTLEMRRWKSKTSS